MRGTIWKETKSLEIPALVLVPARVCSRSLIILASAQVAAEARHSRLQGRSKTCLTTSSHNEVPLHDRSPPECTRRKSFPCFWRVSQYRGWRKKSLTYGWNMAVQGAVPPTVSHSRGLLEGALPRYKALSNCSGHDPKASGGSRPAFPLIEQVLGHQNSFRIKGPHISLESSPGNCTYKHCKQGASYMQSLGIYDLAVFASAVPKSIFRLDPLVVIMSCSHRNASGGSCELFMWKLFMFLGSVKLFETISSV